MENISLIEWQDINKKIIIQKKEFFHRFKIELDKKFDDFQKKSSINNLWSTSGGPRGIGGRYRPVIDWFIRSDCQNKMMISYEVGNGLSLKKEGFLLPSFSDEIREEIEGLFTVEEGWLLSKKEIMNNYSVINFPMKVNEPAEVAEIWHLGNEPEKFSSELMDFLFPVFENNEIIDLFLTIDR